MSCVPKRPCDLYHFVAPGVVACPVAFGREDPNADVYDATAKLLSTQTDSRGQPLQVVRIPSPGEILDEDGEIIPASHMNFYIGNAAVVVPLYGGASDTAAVAAVDALFPGRKAVGLRADHVLTGGGSFHCISQQVPE